MGSEALTSSISSNAFARLAALFLVGQFPKGVFGLKRLHKVMYLATRSAEVVPFTYRRYLYGEYSDGLDDVKDQLIAMRYISAIPLDTSKTITFSFEGKSFDFQEGGNRYVLGAGHEGAHLVAMFERAAPTTAASIRSGVELFGYFSEAALLEYCYALPEFTKAEEGDILLTANLPGRVDVPLTEDECDDLEFALSPEAMQGLSQIVEALERSEIEWGSVNELDLSVPPRGA